MANLNMNLADVAPHKGEAELGAFDSSRKWSSFQTSIFAFVASDTGNAIVEAVAGSGKSTTIIEAMKLVRGSSIFLAFNKAIADELKAKGVNARTFHSLCFSPVMRALRANEPTMDKLRRLCRDNMSSNDFRLYAPFAQRLVGLARQQGVGFLTPDTAETYWAICEHHDIEPESDDADMHRAIELAQELLGWSNASHMVDFDDMLYFAVKHIITLPKFDFVFVDEAQDTNMIQREILRKIMGPNSRMIAVGDPAQAIYGFRGADANSLQMIAKEFSARTLPLSITYRCPTSVVKYAQQWVSHIQARDNAPEGVVQDLGGDWSVELFKPNDLVVCRKSAPLMTVAFRCIRANIPVQVLGREIGDGLKALIKKMNAKNIDQLSDKLEAYREREVAKALQADDEQKIEAINDKVGAIQFLIDGLKEDRRDIPSLEAGIDYLFKDKNNSVKLCTIHKSKGLEAERVFWLGRSQCPAKWARQPWQKVEEINLCYVAATRAKAELYLIEE
jgi:DNA helicase II / ATP-dependent DNA helicase PcrA